MEFHENFMETYSGIVCCAPPILYFDQIGFWGFPYHNIDLATYIRRGYTSCITLYSRIFGRYGQRSMDKRSAGNGVLRGP